MQMEQESKNSSLIIRYDNLLNEQTRLNELSGKEQDLFFSIVGEFIRLNQDSKKSILSIRIKELDVKRICGMTTAQNNMNQANLSKMLQHVSEVALTSLFKIRKYETDPETGEIIYDENGKPIYGKETQQIFHAFFEGKNKKDITVTLNPEAQRYFFGFLLGNFTQFFLKSYISMSAKHAKALYRQLLNGKNALNGYWQPSKKELMTWFGINNENNLKWFMKKLPVYIDQVLNTGDFISLKYQLIYGTEKGHPIKQFLFTYKLKPNRMEIIEKIEQKSLLMEAAIPVYLRTIEETPKKRTIKKSPCLCSVCKGEVYRLKTNDGNIFLCENNAAYHLGTAQCKNDLTKEINQQQIWNDAIDKEESFEKKKNINDLPQVLPTKESRATAKTETPRIPQTKEVQEYFKKYMKEKNIMNSIDYEDFYDYYQSVGWMKNKDPITDWQALARLWIKRQLRFIKQDGYTPIPNEPAEEDYETKRERVMQEFKNAGWPVN